MNCANHPELQATAFCRDCGKAMCSGCQHPAMGSVFCADHVPAAAVPPASAAPPPFAGSPYAATAPVNPSPYTSTSTQPQVFRDHRAHPVLALILGFMPGVGALYNGQYAKGLIHAVVFGLLVSLASNSHGSLEPLFGIMIGAWVFYMAFEAFHTAKKRRDGVAIEEFSSLFDVRPTHGKFPAGAILLIGIGFILLLDTTDVIDMYQLERFWPVGLIIFGIYMLYARLSDKRTVEGENAEAPR
jgi:TM2 domain-containing membrane protein YozV